MDEKIVPVEKLQPLADESNELVAIFVSIVKNGRANL
jgi:hypothetical protein